MINTITSNVYNRLLKIRQGVVYDSVTSVIGEILQNCQRAKAKNIKCTTYDDAIVITDDGVGCKNPSTLFTLDQSEWGSTTEGFGEGFTSVYAVADLIMVRSHNWEVNLDVINMINNQDLSYKVEKGHVYKKGFEIHISGEVIKNNIYELRSFLRKSARLIEGIKIEIDGEELDKKDYSEIGATFQKNYTNNLYTAYFAPATYSNYVDIYYEGRLVCQEYMQGIRGNLVLKAGAVTLKAPDRRSIINDGKKQTYLRMIRNDTQNLYEAFIKIATNEDIDTFSYQIAGILKVEDYEDMLEVGAEMLETKVIESENGETRKGITGIEYSKKDEDWKEWDRREENNINESQIAKVNEIIQDVLPRKKKNVFLRDIASSEKTFWVKPNEVISSQESIQTLEYYGFKAFVAINDLYEAVFHKYRTPHISEILTKLVQEFTIENCKLRSEKEERIARNIFRIIENHYGIHGVFHIADLKMQMVMKGDRESKSKEIIIEGACKDGKIYLNRKDLQLSSYNISPSKNISTDDLRFLLRNLDTISHELAHHVFSTKDNTLQHSQTQAIIAKEIANLF